MVERAGSAKEQRKSVGSRACDLATVPVVVKSASQIIAVRTARIRVTATDGPAYLRDVEEALSYLAYLIETRPEGEAYWPLFDRLEIERERLVSRKERLRVARARQLTRQEPAFAPAACFDLRE